MSKVTIWDNFTRIYHMSQLILLALLWYSGEQADFELHFTCGYLMLSLFITRLVWGLIGSDTSRFVHFVKTPKTVLNSLKQKPSPTHGHSPVAGYMVVALLLALGAQLFTGLFATDDVLAEGPLIYSVSDSFAESMDSLHHEIFNILLALIALHAVAGIVHSIKADNVIKVILTGKSSVHEPHSLSFKSVVVPLAIWAVLFGLMAYFWLADVFI